MFERFVVPAILACALASNAFAADGLVSMRSPHAVKQTIDRMEAAARARELTVFLRLDHAAGARKAGQALRDTELLLFGNPQGGTPLMQCAQLAGIDLPLKVMAWKDAHGQVWLAYNDPAWIAARHGARDECVPVVKKMSGLLDAMAHEAVKP